MYTELVRHDRTLRPYQQDAKDSIFSTWDECNNVMFQMPTGTGKTKLFTSIISDIKTWGLLHYYDVKILIVAHRIELIEQISESLDKYRISHGIIAGGHARNLSQPVQVASIQTITHHTNLNAVKGLNIDFIIIDEAHHSMANSYRKLWELYPDAKKLGVTATPWRMNNIGFTSIYNKLIVSQSVKKFIEQGWLAPYTYYSVSSNSSILKTIDSIDEFDIEGDYKISALEKKMDTAPIRAQLLDSYLKLAKGKKGIIYSISRKHSDHICEEFKAADINIVRIDSETPRNERRLYVSRFKEGKIDIIVNVDIFSEGFDCPDIEFIQLARPTRSLVKFLQQVGRGLRPTQGKSNCIILDNVGLHSTFGLPNADREWQSFFEGQPIECPSHTTRERTRAKTSPGSRSFEEGSDELLLIEDLDGAPIPSKEPTHPLWDTADDELLKVLYVDRNCPIDIIASVFRKDESLIFERIAALNLQQENHD